MINRPLTFIQAKKFRTKPCFHAGKHTHRFRDLLITSPDNYATIMPRFQAMSLIISIYGIALDSISRYVQLRQKCSWLWSRCSNNTPRQSQSSRRLYHKLYGAGRYSNKEEHFHCVTSTSKPIAMLRLGPTVFPCMVPLARRPSSRLPKRLLSRQKHMEVTSSCFYLRYVLNKKQKSLELKVKQIFQVLEGTLWTILQAYCLALSMKPSHILLVVLSVYEVSKPAIANDHLIWHRRKGKIIGAVQNQ